MKANIEEDLEWSSSILVILSCLCELVLTIWLLNTDEVLVDLEFLQGTSCDKETSGICGRPVCKTVLDSISLELMRVCRSEDFVARNLGGDDLADDISVGESNN